MDEVFEQEQQHLSETYEKLLTIEHELQHELAQVIDSAKEDKDSLLEELSMDSQDDVHVETMAQYESFNRLMDSYSLSAGLATQRLHYAQQLLEQPYFAKVSVRFKPNAPAKNIYIGSAGITDDDYHHIIVDWRSPIAELYYNQENGPTSYVANGRTINVDLELRRQFDISKDTLNAYFDTTVAIQDPLLLQSLSKQRAAQLSAITTTIQKEQNVVVRHEDDDVLLVEGIAGSGKTSVLLQRIAYLLYQNRETLNSKDVYLLSPNPVFSRYIENVLPEMGESNPQSITWDEFMESLGLESRGLGNDPSTLTLEKIASELPSFKLVPGDFADLRVGDECVISATQAKAAYDKLARFECGEHRCQLVIEDLLGRLEQRIKRLARSDEAQDEMFDLDEENQLAAFGEYATPDGEAEVIDYTTRYLNWRYEPVREAIEQGKWLRIDHIGMRLLGKETLSCNEWLYLRMLLVGGRNISARYVMVDEVQDYTPAQLMVLASYFKNAHFLLLGDENQAIKEDTASFEEVREVFEKVRGAVSECKLMTSYRSSPEITALFSSLLAPDVAIEVQSVQRPGTKPRIIECKSGEEFADKLQSAVASARESGMLCALIAPNKQRVKQLKKLLGEDSGVVELEQVEKLPSSGVVLLDVKLAKGLEFDQAIIAYAQKADYPENDLSRRRLYTAISRATQQVTLIAEGTLTPLLADAR